MYRYTYSLKLAYADDSHRELLLTLSLDSS